MGLLGVPCQRVLMPRNSEPHRPSLVRGTMMAVFPRKNARSKTRWMPWLGAIMPSNSAQPTAYIISKITAAFDDDMSTDI